MKNIYGLAVLAVSALFLSGCVQKQADSRLTQDELNLQNTAQVGVKIKGGEESVKPQKDSNAEKTDNKEE